MPWNQPLLWTFLLVSHSVGLITAVVALMSTRTPQGTVAWILGLITFPYLAVPMFWVFGHRRFEGYLVARRDRVSRLRKVLEEQLKQVQPWRIRIDEVGGGIQALEAMARLPLLSGNEVELLVDGETIFASLLAGIRRAQSYLLVQFYIVKDDEVGEELKRALLEKADEGVRVYFLYDQVGSYSLSSHYLDHLRNGGVEVQAFRSTRGLGMRFQINFRNHRKVVVADGVEGWVGGINIGNDYVGRDPTVDPMRETHLRIQGPAAAGLQLSFLEDWNWAADEVLDLSWGPGLPLDTTHMETKGTDHDRAVLILPSGPADQMETGSLLVQHAVHSAEERLWISSPYFVPDSGVMAALRLAALRGVDVRILIPDRADHLVVGLASFPFVGDLLEAGVRFFRYEPGFLHAKTVLLDNNASAVGTLNLDNRSFRLNFEITALVLDTAFASEMEAMFLNDFGRSREMTAEEVSSRPFGRRALSRAAALFAPVL
ncbi:MAG: cardiolipin synthase [Gemmatimonadota bacterium]